MSIFTTVTNHLNGTSGLTNAMLSATLKQQYSSLTNSQKTSLQSMLFHATRDEDTDKADTAEWLLRELCIIRDHIRKEIA